MGLGMVCWSPGPRGPLPTLLSCSPLEIYWIAKAAAPLQVRIGGSLPRSSQTGRGEGRGASSLELHSLMSS